MTRSPPTVLSGRVIAEIGIALILLIGSRAAGQDVIAFPQPGIQEPFPDSQAPFPDYPVVFADLNGDGLPDAITSLRFGFEVRLGRGNGTFGLAMISGDDSDSVQTLLLGDIDGDGETDIVNVYIYGTLSGLSGSIEGFMGNGDGTFAKSTLTDAPYGFTGFDTMEQVLADMDGDGRADCLSSAGGQLHIAHSLGDGTFSIAQEIPQDAPATPLTVADFDGDGLLDVAITSAMGSVASVHLNLGLGVLAENTVDSPLPSETSAPGLASSDFDHDGLPELVAAEHIAPGAGLLIVLHAAGAGAFGPMYSVPAPGGGRPCVGDLDGNGTLDIVVAHSPEGDEPPGLSAFLFNGQTPVAIVSDAPPDGVPQILEIDGDGIADVALGSCFVSGAGDGTFVTRHEIALDGEEPTDIGAADVNLDGAPDLVCTLDSNELPLAIALGHGDGSFAPVVRLLPDKHAEEMAIADIDNDGDSDVIVSAQPLPAHVTCWFNDGSGTAYPTSANAFAFGASDIDVMDIDGDGLLDLGAVAEYKGGLWVALADGVGGFLPATMSPCGGIGFSLDLADLDGDGLTDAVVAHTGQVNPVSLLYGIGGGQFAPFEEPEMQGWSREVVAADLDDDGVLDLLATFEPDFFSPTPPGVLVMLAEQPGVFGQGVLSPGLGLGSIEPPLMDIDRDGLVDFVGRSFGHLATHHGFGNGSFAPPLAYATGAESGGGALADFDGDGRVDAAVISADEHSIEVLPNSLPGFPSLGYQHDGGFGFPHLVGTGTPAADEKVSLTTTGVPAGGLGFLIVGLQFSPQLFKGGTLVPSPDFAIPMQAGVPLVGRWPALSEGVQVLAQAWFSVPGDVAASNAIMGIEP